MASSFAKKSLAFVLTAACFATFGCASSSQDEGQIVSSKLPGTAVTKPEGDLATTGGGSSGSGGSSIGGEGTGGSAGGTADEASTSEEPNPALIMRVINTVL